MRDVVGVISRIDARDSGFALRQLVGRPVFVHGAETLRDAGIAPIVVNTTEPGVARVAKEWGIEVRDFQEETERPENLGAPEGAEVVVLNWRNPLVTAAEV